MTPFIQQIWWLLVAEAVAILFLCLPFHVPYRRSVVDWLANSTGPVLGRVRFGFGVTHAGICLLWADNFRRLVSLDGELDIMKEADVVVNRDAVFTLYSRRSRAQRDNHIMVRFVGTHPTKSKTLVLLGEGRYRKERNEYKSRYELLAKKHGVEIEPVEVRTATGSKKTIGAREATKRS